MSKTLAKYSEADLIQALIAIGNYETDNTGQIVIYTGEYAFGVCDDCDFRFDLSDREDHCGECGTCWTHCVEGKAHYTEAVA